MHKISGLGCSSVGCFSVKKMLQGREAVFSTSSPLDLTAHSNVSSLLSPCLIRETLTHSVVPSSSPVHTHPRLRPQFGPARSLDAAQGGRRSAEQGHGRRDWIGTNSKLRTAAVDLPRHHPRLVNSCWTQHDRTDRGQFVTLPHERD